MLGKNRKKSWEKSSKIQEIKKIDEKLKTKMNLIYCSSISFHALKCSSIHDSSPQSAKFPDGICHLLTFF